MKTIEDEYQLGGWLEGGKEGGSGTREEGALASQRGASFSYAAAAAAATATDRDRLERACTRILKLSHTVNLRTASRR